MIHPWVHHHGILATPQQMLLQRGRSDNCMALGAGNTPNVAMLACSLVFLNFSDCHHLVTCLIGAAMRHNLDQSSGQQGHSARLRIPAYWAMSQSTPTASKANSVTILANRNWKLTWKFKT